MVRTDLATIHSRDFEQVLSGNGAEIHLGHPSMTSKIVWTESGNQPVEAWLAFGVTELFRTNP